MCFLLLVLVGMSSFGLSSAYTNGSISSVCSSMVPGHDNTPQSTTPPYQITVSNTTYGPGDSITVTLNTTENGTVFLGFMLQARRTVNGARVGTFSSSDTSPFRLHDCSSITNSTISHASTDNKTQFQATWVAPLASSPGNIEFCATFVKNYSYYWTMVKSSVITQSSANPVISVSAHVMSTCVLTALAVIFRSFY